MLPFYCSKNRLSASIRVSRVIQIIDFLARSPLCRDFMFFAGETSSSADLSHESSQQRCMLIAQTTMRLWGGSTYVTVDAKLEYAQTVLRYTCRSFGIYLLAKTHVAWPDNGYGGLIINHVSNTSLPPQELDYPYLNKVICFKMIISATKTLEHIVYKKSFSSLKKFL